jgi:acid phosphatase
MLAALDIFSDSDPLPITHVARARKWRTSQVTPMGGRTTLELMSCDEEGILGGKDHSKFVRLNINDGIVPIPGCRDGPGGSCKLEQFADRVRERGREVGDFRTVCGLGEDMPDRITFLHQD